jgi:hypothetical protein
VHHHGAYSLTVDPHTHACLLFSRRGSTTTKFISHWHNLEKNLSQLKMTTRVRHTCSLIVLVARAGWTQQREGVDLIQSCECVMGMGSTGERYATQLVPRKKREPSDEGCAAELTQNRKLIGLLVLDTAANSSCATRAAESCCVCWCLDGRFPSIGFFAGSRSSTSQAQGKFAQMTQDLAITDYLFSRNMNH